MVSTSTALRLALVALAAAVLTVIGGPARAVTVDIYVSATSGNDSNPGTSGLPVKTIQKAVDISLDGATIHVANGRYNGFTTQRANGTTANQISIVGESRAVRITPKLKWWGNPPGYEAGNVVTLKGQGVQLRTVTVSGCVPGGLTSGQRIEDYGAAGVRVEGSSHVVSDVEVTHGWSTDRWGVASGCYAVLAFHAAGVTITGNDFWDNGAGVFINNGSGAAVTNNTIHDNAHLVRNTPKGANDDFGAVGITFFEIPSTAAQSVASGNIIYNNQAPSYDYGVDGGGIEIFGASNVSMTNNTLTGNDGALETGGEPGSFECANNSFTGNHVVGYNSTYPGLGAGGAPRKGFVLRCDRDMTISGNDITNVDYWTFFLSQGDPNDPFATTLQNLHIQSNTVTQATQLIFQARPNPGSVNGLVINGNTYSLGQCQQIAKVWNSTTSSYVDYQRFADWKQVVMSQNSNLETTSTSNCP